MSESFCGLGWSGRVGKNLCKTMWAAGFFRVPPFLFCFQGLDESQQRRVALPMLFHGTDNDGLELKSDGDC